VKFLSSVFSRVDPPSEFQVSCAADWDKIPFGFCRVQANGRESLAYRDPTFGVLRDVKPVFRIGALQFRLDRPLSELPNVHTHVVIAEPGLLHVNGLTVVDTDKGMPDGVVEYEPSAP
jgi:hypothetical protein